MTAISAYPLCWPPNVPRAQRREADNAAREAALRERG